MAELKPLPRMTSEARVSAISIGAEATILETLRKIDKASEHGAPVGIMVVVDNDGRLLGVATDGDIRQAIVEGVSVEAQVSQIMTREPIVVREGMSATEMIRQMNENVRRSAHIRDTKVEYLIVLSDDDRVVDVIDTVDLFVRADITNWNVGVIGLGFVGLTLGVTLADAGFNVHGIEVHQERATAIEAGKPHFHEAGLEPLLKHQLSTGRFRVHTGLPKGIDIYIIAVGTPLDVNDVPQLSAVEAAAHEIASQLKRGNVVLLRSTVPVGTSRDVVLPILEKQSGLICGDDFHLAFVPERTIEGQALRELKTLPQVVGGFDRQSTELTSRLFSKLSPSVVRVESLEAAEMAKLINNSFRDLSFAFANEFAIICNHWNLDATRIIEAANAGYPRNPIPVPSPGVGGFCLTKDPVIYALAGKQKGYEPRLPKSGRAVNEHMVGLMATKILRHFSEKQIPTAGAKLFIIGWAFKGHPDTSDMRHSTTLDLLPLLRKAGFEVVGYDPVVPPDEIEGLGVESVSVQEGFSGADAVVVMTNHQSYSEFDLFSLVSTMNRPGLFFDGWHMFSRTEIEEISGIVYEGLSGAM